MNVKTINSKQINGKCPNGHTLCLSPVCWGTTLHFSFTTFLEVMLTHLKAYLIKNMGKSVEKLKTEERYLRVQSILNAYTECREVKTAEQLAALHKQAVKDV